MKNIFPKSRIKKCMTLAEILIVLGIIGVVAGLTIPNLVNDYRKNQTATQVQKVYSELKQAINISASENGEIKDWDWGLFDTGNYSDWGTFFDTYILHYLNVSKKCGHSSFPNACATANFKCLDNSNSKWSLYTIAILNNGTMLYLTPSTAPNATGIYISFDINGAKSPNMLGKDIFVLSVSKAENKSFLPIEKTARETLLGDSQRGCNKTATFIPGWYCGALIQQDGWKIGEGYPWN